MAKKQKQEATVITIKQSVEWRVTFEIVIANK